MPFLGSPSTPSKPLRKITPGRFWVETSPPPRHHLVLYPQGGCFFVAWCYPEQAFLLCIPEQFFMATTETPTLIPIIFLGN